jgi:hypothetical protein
MGLHRRQILTILSLGLLGWALCGAVMFAGMAALPLGTALIVHAVAAPVIFAAISWLYFARWGYTTPIATAAMFMLVVVFMDFFLVALVINRSLDMFRGTLGTWIPFGLIFLSTYLTGLGLSSRARQLDPL